MTATPPLPRNMTLNPGQTAPETLYDASGAAVRVMVNPCPGTPSTSLPGEIRLGEGGVAAGMDAFAADVTIGSDVLEQDLGIDVQAMIDLPPSTRTHVRRTPGGFVVSDLAGGHIDTQPAYVIPTKLVGNGDATFGPFKLTLPGQSVSDLFDTDELGAALIVFPIGPETGT